jgi:phosphate butyryltransferase
MIREMSFEDLYQRVRTAPSKTINVVNPLHDSVFSGLQQAADQDLIQIRFYGNAHHIEAQCKKHKITDPFIGDADSPETAAKMAVADIREQKGDLLMKGDISTAALLKPVLDRHHGLRKGDILSHVAVMEHPALPRLLFITDGGINISINLEQRRSITRNAIDFAQKVLNRKPVIGMTALIEQVNEKIPETGESKIIADELIAEGYLADGPIAPDVLFSPQAAHKKGVSDQISGKADIFVAPNISVANFMIKLLIELDKARVGGIIWGAKVPIILLSRSDEAQTKLNSIVLGLL